MWLSIIPSVLHQLGAGEPLFKRAISMSGTPLMLKPQAAFSFRGRSILQHLTSPGSRERLNAGQDQPLPQHQCRGTRGKSTDGLPPTPFQDNEILPQSTAFSGLENDTISSLSNTWFEELVTGSCTHDDNMFFFMGLSALFPNVATALTSSLSRSLPSSAAETVLSAYDIETPTPDDVEKDSAS